MDRWLLVCFAVCVLSRPNTAQSQSEPLAGVTHESTLYVVQRDGSCVRGMLSKADPKSLTIVPFQKQPITLQWDQLLEVSQGDALLFTARSSWARVEHTNLYPREALIVVTKKGKQVKGHPLKMTDQSITMRHGLNTTVFTKSDVAIVDYLRDKPATDNFLFVLEEAPWALIFYPELYSRMVGLEGRLPVRLYDASKPEDDNVSDLRNCR
jgi:hypothetical protein